MAVESFNGLYKWELIYPKAPGTGSRTSSSLASPASTGRFNNRRLHGQITAGPGYTTPAAFEADYNYQNVPTT